MLLELYSWGLATPFVENLDYALSELMGDEFIIAVAFAIFAIICLDKYKNFYSDIWAKPSPLIIPSLTTDWNSLAYCEYFGTVVRSQEAISLVPVATASGVAGLTSKSSIDDDNA